MEVTQYTIRIPITAGPGISSQDYVDLRLTKEKSHWITSSNVLDWDWTFQTLEIAQDRIENELKPLIQAYFNTKAAFEFARRDLSSWQEEQWIIGATKADEPAKV